jgi:hypothetical protein
MRLAIALVLVAAIGCGDAAAPPRSSPTPRAVGGTPLPLGKSDVPLKPGRWRSPDTFSPAVSVEVTGAGWQSAHRFEDMFDVGRPEPGKDVPRLAIAFSLATGPTAADVERDVRARTGSAVSASVPDRIGSATATRFDLVGGTGEVYRSVTGGFGLYADARQRVRFWVADVGGRVLVVTAIVPDAAKHWATELPRATAVVASAEVA